MQLSKATRTAAVGAAVAFLAAALAAGVPPPAPAPASPPAAAPSPDQAVISFLERRVRADPDDVTALNRLAGEYLRRFRTGGDDEDLTRSYDAAARSLKAVPVEVNSAGLAARARAEFSLHQFSQARDDARQFIAREPEKPYGFQILGDALLELGDLAEAAQAYEQMLRGGEPDAGTEARLGRLALLRGETDAAREHLAAAVEFARPLTSPETLAWCLVQQGQLAFSGGDWPRAEEAYRAALVARPSDWAATEHLAELRAAQKQWDAAIVLYGRAIERAPRPELMQALGDVYATMGRPQGAGTWHRRALEKYLKASESGHAHYYHHLVGYYCDVENDPVEALKWAKKDMAVRHSVYAYDGIAWALYQGGQFAAAADAMDKALAAGTRDAHLLYHASLVYYRAGDTARARKSLAAAASANPKYNEFHAHR